MLFPEIKNTYEERNIDIESIIKLSKVASGDFRNCAEDADFSAQEIVDQFYKVHGNFPYAVNSFNLVGEEINHQAPVLAIGCSVTASVGIPHQLTWPNLLRKVHNTDVNVIASPGLDISEITRILNVYLISENFSTPEAVYILAPDILRTKLINFHKFSKKNIFDHITLNYNNNLGFIIKSTLASLKDKHLKKYYPSVSYTLLNRLSALEMCVSLCRAFGVKIIISSWEMYTQKIFQDLGYVSDLEQTNCFSNESRSWHMVNQCTKHNFEVPEHLKPFWDSAVDKPHFHPGLHSHIHYLENFLQKDIDYRILDDLSYDPAWLNYISS